MVDNFKNFINEEEIYLFNTGEAQQAYKAFGCHYIPDADAHRFMVWAPNAKAVSVVGDFNGWDPLKNPMEKLGSGVYATFIKDIQNGANYKYNITGFRGETIIKADPFAFHAEVRPGTASKVWDLNGYVWQDGGYLKDRKTQNVFTMPLSIYEMHLGSWRIKEGYKFPNIREVADELSDYVTDMGYTHVELLPVMEYPLDASWGYQVTGFFSVTSRYGTPQDYMYFVDTMHKKGIGVIMDWVPAHFPKDAFGLARFDGTSLFEHSNPIQANHPQWGTLIFNYSRPEVVSFLVSSAMMFFDVYHIDGIRVDAVTSMLYLDYARNKGEFIPNVNGGNIDLDAEAFLKKLNSVILTRYPGVMTIAEESTSYPNVTKPPYDGGLGFTYKWNMGFMHDTLKYFSLDHFFRQFNHSKLTFLMYYAFTENFILPYSHDEVVHGKKSMLDKMFGSYNEKFATLRALYGYMYTHPGKKLMFMGSEFGQYIEWDFNKELDWFLLEYPKHRQMQAYVKALNKFYTGHPALYMKDDGWEGFKWLNCDNAKQSSISFMRIGGEESCVCAFNFTPVPVEGFVIGLPEEGILTKVFSSDEEEFGGSGRGDSEPVNSVLNGFSGLPYSASLSIPPLSAVIYDFNAGPPKSREALCDKNTEIKAEVREI